jgi:tetratricopeptide (TPR) repeat protein
MNFEYRTSLMNAKHSIPLFSIIILLPMMAFAQSTEEVVSKLQREWAVANYEIKGDAQIKAYEALIEKADVAVAENSGSAEILVWNGIIKSAFAGVKGGLGALSYAKQAKKQLEASLEIDPGALNGSAYASLGTLYSKVPGWPVGFGNDKKAVQFLKKALVINPDGIDPNYFYGDYLLDKKDYAGAEEYLLKALNAEPRAERPIADAGRKQEIDVALAVVRKKLKRSSS